MITLRLKHVVLLALSAAITLSPAQRASRAESRSDPAANVLAAIPADCVFCLRIDNLDYSMGQIDQFLVGLSPMPMGLSMLVRMQLAGILGDPQLAGVNMGGEFAVFSVPMPGATDPNAGMFTGVLVPVTSYEAFVANPSVAQPDARGVSQIVSQGGMMPGMPPLPPMAAKQAGGFALVTLAEHADMLAAVADSISSGRSPALGSIPGVKDNTTVSAPIWIYVDGQKAAAQAKASGGQGGALPVPTMPGMPNIDLTAALEDMQTATIGLAPSANAITIMTRVSAVPGTELAQTFVRGSAGSTELFEMIGAKAPNQMGAEMAAVSALLPQAAQADVAGTYDLMQLASLADTLPMPIPISLPRPSAPSKSGIAYAAAVYSGNLAVDIAVPKEHVVEIVASLKEAAPSGVAQGETTTIIEAEPVQIDFPNAEDEPDDEISMITASPFGDLPTTTTSTQVEPREIIMPVQPVQPTQPVQPSTSLFGDGGFDSVTTPVAPTQGIAEKVRVAGVRLIRYSDLKLGVLPLGRGDGYTLSLIAELPEPAVKVSGGQVDKAVTNNGANLLPADQWDRKVRFGRLSKDYKTAVFDVELLLPDPGVLGLQELAGTLEYFTASGTKDADLGLVALKVGAKGSQLDARISSIEIDPYANNSPIVGLTLNVSGDAVESVELYDRSGQRLEILHYGSTSGGNATTVKFFVKDKLPADARIVVHIFEGLQKHGLPFSIRAISIAGLPMQ